MTPQEVENINIDDIITTRNNKTYRVIGFLREEGEIHNVIVEFPGGGVPIQDIMDNSGDWEIPQKYLKKEFWPWKPEDIISYISYKNTGGATCIVCNIYNEYIQINNGDKYICYQCKLWNGKV